MVKLRLSDHHLMIEMGRCRPPINRCIVYNNIPDINLDNYAT